MSATRPCAGICISTFAVQLVEHFLLAVAAGADASDRCAVPALALQSVEAAIYVGWPDAVSAVLEPRSSDIATVTVQPWLPLRSSTTVTSNVPRTIPRGVESDVTVKGPVVTDSVPLAVVVAVVVVDDSVVVAAVVVVGRVVGVTVVIGASVVVGSVVVD